MSANFKFAVSIFLVTCTGATMLYMERKSGDDHGIIIKLELAPTIKEVERLIAPYDEIHIEWLRWNTELDFVFIMTYTALFFFALKIVLQRFPDVKRTEILLGIAFLPGVLDVIENIYILHFLQHDFGTAYYRFYYWCVHFKWVLVGVYTVFSLFALAIVIRDNTKTAMNYT